MQGPRLFASVAVVVQTRATLPFKQRSGQTRARFISALLFGGSQTEVVYPGDRETVTPPPQSPDSWNRTGPVARRRRWLCPCDPRLAAEPPRAPAPPHTGGGDQSGSDSFRGDAKKDLIPPSAVSQEPGLGGG
ncbi:unnamed protein product [Arctogadus glacialis]